LGPYIIVNFGEDKSGMEARIFRLDMDYWVDGSRVEDSEAMVVVVHCNGCSE